MLLALLHLAADGDEGPQQQAKPAEQPSALIERIQRFTDSYNPHARPFVWTATADEILAKVRWVETNIKQLVANNSK